MNVVGYKMIDIYLGEINRYVDAVVCVCIGIKDFPSMNCSYWVFRCQCRVFADFIAAIAMMTRWNEIAKIDRIKWVNPFGKIVVIGFSC